MRACGLWLLCLVVAGPLVAQPATFDVRGKPLDEALRLARQRGRFDTSYDPALVAGRTSRCMTTATAPEPLLACVLEGTGLIAVRLPGGVVATFGLRPAPPPEPPPSARLRGRVLDAETGLPLTDASVMIVHAGRGVLSGADGVFVFGGLPQGIVLVRASYVGYSQAQAAVRLAVDSTSSVTLSLQRAPAVITPVVVEGLRFRDPLVLMRMAEPPRDAPNASPEEVASRLVAMTGVHPGRVVADLHLQGGESGEHLMTLDGAPIYAPPVVAGLVGPFSPFAIGRITLRKAGYGALPISSTVGVIEAEHTFPVDEGRRFDVQADALGLHARLASGGERPDGLRVQLMMAGRLGRNAGRALPALDSLLRNWNRPDPFLAAVTASDLRPSSDPALPFLERTVSEVPQLRFNVAHIAVQALHPSGRRLLASAYVGTRQL
ncbi:MAG TPA: carboxypeptidase-like regulatory domain-containing protein, partial [Rhodothermales bacterium]|nr:carboxypeptidase-like regulatory domain-containing protein [Rhodothermales bacterium]